MHNLDLIGNHNNISSHTSNGIKTNSIDTQ
jgi:hypothetical protein